MVATDDPAGAAGFADDGGVRFGAQFDEPLARVLDIGTWSTGADLDRLYERLDREVLTALAQDAGYRQAIRERIFPALGRRTQLGLEGGVHQATPEQIRAVHQGLLFNGAVEAADGTVALHETLPLSVAQIGVGLVSYQGDQGTWAHRLFRRDVRVRADGDPDEERLDLLERRRLRGGLGEEDRDPLSNLARRSLMTYAERAVLLQRSTARWRMGHGRPVAAELLTNAAESFLDASLRVLRGLILDHQRFVFVASAPFERVALTLGAALAPLEYTLLWTMEADLVRFVERGGHPAYATAPLQKALDFAHEVGPLILVGIYRASSLAPAQIFFAHADHAHEAALIALADSVLHEHRGFPLLIDLADMVCSAHFNASGFAGAVGAAYAAAGAPYRYLHERASRKG
jgi:hypothetical protein